MKIFNKIRCLLLSWAEKTMSSREPDQIIRRYDGVAYLKRWKIVRLKYIFNLYIHQFVEDDDDRGLHDHPWASLSIILHSDMTEELPNNKTRFVEFGDIVYRSAKYSHRIVLSEPTKILHDYPITLFLTGPKIRAWGFHTKDGWLHHKDFFVKEPKA